MWKAGNSLRIRIKQLQVNRS